jgi:hypothetical protein
VTTSQRYHRSTISVDDPDMGAFNGELRRFETRPPLRFRLATKLVPPDLERSRPALDRRNCKRHPGRNAGGRDPMGPIALSLRAIGGRGYALDA